MEEIRFEKFTLLVEGIQKAVNKLKLDIAPSLGVKSVHVFWVWRLYLNPEGLTSAELAAKSLIDRSLVSREIAALKKDGYVEYAEGSGGKNYNRRIVLTEKGSELAERICRVAMGIQDEANHGIDPEDLENLYPTLNKIYENLSNMTKERMENP